MKFVRTNRQVMVTKKDTLDHNVYIYTVLG